jgi:hydroxymethylpyrimidine kinase/phosphomethylpyrimidine kinase
MVSTSGAQLLPGDAVRNLREKLLPISTLLTPNIPEATLLLRDADMQYKSPSNLEDLKALAKMVHQLGPQAVLLKGGHMPLTTSYTKAATDAERALTVDILYDGSTFTTIESPYLTAKNTHGTGCSLASAIASNVALQEVSSKKRSPSEPLALALDLPLATRKAVHYVACGIRLSNPSLGQGAGPINHFHSLQILPFSPGHFIDTHLLVHPTVREPWHRYTHHAFPAAMATGTLPERLFKNYLVQDYLYLVHFARTHALAAYKSRSMPEIAASAHIILHVQREMALHLGYCAEFGISQAELDDPARSRESLACTAYSRYVLDVGASQDWLALQMALAPCLIGYGVTAARLAADPASVKGTHRNPYWRWVENYVADDYCDAVRVGRGEFSILVYANVVIMGERGRGHAHTYDSAGCVALRCVALRCVALPSPVGAIHLLTNERVVSEQNLSRPISSSRRRRGSRSWSPSLCAPRRWKSGFGTLMLIRMRGDV